MSEVNWDLAPEGATMIISSDKELRWANEDGQWWFDKVDGWKFLTGNPLKLSCWKAIATRPTQKTVEDAVEQDGEKWTHLTPIGDPCFIKLNEPDSEGLILIEILNDGYDLVNPEQLKPIKKKLTKAQAWDLCQDYDGPKSMKAYMYDLHDEYDIT